MFVILRKRKLNKFDAICECVSASMRLRSFRPMSWIFKRGRYGSQHQLEGNFLDYMRYCERTGKPIGVAMGK